MKLRIIQFIVVTIYLLSQISCQNYNTEDAHKWQWSTLSPRSLKYENKFQTYGYTTIYVNDNNGIEIKDDGTSWKVKIREHGQSSSYICFGIQEINELNLRHSSDQKNFATMICSNGNIYSHTGASNPQIISDLPLDPQDYVDTVWQLILTPQKLIIHNENDGGSSRVEWDINTANKYFPIIHTYNQNFHFEVNTCGFRCETCNDFEYGTCKSCKTTDNIKDIPSCSCKDGYTDIYDYQQNLTCKIQTEKYWKPNIYTDFHWTYGRTSNPPKDPQNGIFHTNYKSAHTHYAYVDNLENGLPDIDDGTEWDVKILEDSYSLNSGEVCFGLQNLDRMGNDETLNAGNFWCTDDAIYGNQYRIRERRWGKTNTQDVNTKIGNTFRMRYSPKIGIFQISNVAFGGDITIEIDVDRTVRYIPIVYMRTGSTAYIWKIQVDTCMPYCKNCSHMQPSVCLEGCHGADNRVGIPTCNCKPGYQDNFRHPNIHWIQEECIEEYEYYEIQPPEFEWYSETSSIEQDDYGIYSTTGNHATIKMKNGDHKGLVSQHDGIKLTAKILAQTSTGHVCFGLQKSEKLHTLTNWNSHQVNEGPSICNYPAPNKVKNYDNLGYYIRGTDMPDQMDAVGKTYDMMYSNGWFIVSDEAYGGTVRYEFDLDDNLDYIPVISIWAGNSSVNIKVQVNQCSPRCKSCIPFEPHNCITCNDENNREEAPSCACKSGMEDLYRHLLNPICRKIIKYIEPSPPQWVWYQDGGDFIEDAENQNWGSFYIDRKEATLKILGIPTLSQPTKWTFNIKEFEFGFFCMGIQAIEYHEQLDMINHQNSYLEGICPYSRTIHKNKVSSFRQWGVIKNTYAEITNTSYDFYFEKDLFIITDKDHGGDLWLEMDLPDNINFTPIISASNSSSGGGVRKTIQVHGCSPRCNTCVKFEPNNCITCSNSENRGAAPDCFPKNGFEDYYDHQVNSYARPLPKYYVSTPPSWVWESEATHIVEDLENENNGVFTLGDTRYDGNILLKDTPPLEDYTQWEIKIVNHIAGTTGKICMGIIETQKKQGYNFDSTEYSKGSAICSDNNTYNPDGIGSASIYGEMPKSNREQLNGTVFVLKYNKGFLNINNINSGGNTGVDFNLNPNLNYTPFIYLYNDVTVQVKACSHRCEQCVDYQPTTCLVCNDQYNRQASPSCLCKDGYYDTYDHQYNKKCIPIPEWKEFSTPEWEWQNIGVRGIESQEEGGVFRTVGGHANFYVKGYPILQDYTRFVVKIKNQKTSAGSFFCFGIMKAENIEKLGVDHYQYDSAEAQCNVINRTYKSSAYNYVKFNDFSLPVEDHSGTYVAVYYRKDLMVVTNEEFGGQMRTEYFLNSKMNYTPFVHAYETGNDTVGQLIQFKQCSYKCQTCIDFNPNQCIICNGDNRELAPSCVCKDGFTDVYRGQVYKNCIKNPKQYSDWEWISQSSKISDLGNNSFESLNGYSYTYVDLGRDGIPELEEGVKWNIKLEHIETNSEHFCIGIIRAEKLYTTLENPTSITHSCSLCTNRGVYYDGCVSQKTIENMLSPIIDNSGMTYDILYKDGKLDITSTSYGGIQNVQFELKQGIAYVPLVTVYSSNNTRPVRFNIKPCDNKCDTCQYVDGNPLYQTCADSTNRGSAPDCKCNDLLFDDGTQICQQCDNNCATCNKKGACLTCITQNNRLNNPPNCTCKSGYYEDSAFECQQCQNICSECIENASNCISCKNQIGRNQNPKDCSCLDGYYEEAGNCEKCPSQCKTCENNSGNCLICASDRTYLKGNNNVCTCGDTGYLEDGICGKCENPCLGCSSKNICTSCLYVGIFREGIPSCKCQSGYYEDSKKICQSCMEGCEICMDFSTNCQKCIDDPNRSSDPTDCSCNEGFTKNFVTGLCEYNVCPIKCGQCVVGSITQCESCKTGTGLHRLDIYENCGCEDGYFDDGNSLECQKCRINCLTCDGADSCLQCISTSNRGLKPLCQCNVGYFEDGSGNCQKCDYKCGECINSKSNCTSCNSLDSNRQQTGSCACNPGYAEDTVQEKCIQSSVCALKCDTCDAVNTGNCLTCAQGVTNRKLIGDNCICKDGYYDDGISSICQICISPCQNCISQIQCLTCKYNGENREIAPLCTCKIGYIEDSSHNCVLNNNCKVEEGRKQEGDCSCLKGYFENDQDSCQKCNEECEECDNISGCTVCAFGYQSNSLPSCQVCDKQCGDCGLNSSDCTECTSNRENPPICGCLDGYYETDDINQRGCLKCSDSCESCTQNAQNCISCISNEIGRNPSPSCTCINGYYQDQETKKCQKCDSQCQTCENTAYNCLICRPGNHRTMEIPSCGCELGYFSSYFSNNCSKCDSQCINRTEDGYYTNDQGDQYVIGELSDINSKIKYEQNGGSLQPTVDEDGNPIENEGQNNGNNSGSVGGDNDSNNNQNNTGNSYENPYNSVPDLTPSTTTSFETEIVEGKTQCAQQCQTCDINNPYICVECVVGLNRISNPPTCGCKDGYYQETYQNDCIQCQDICKTCFNGQVCTSCYKNSNRYLDAMTGVCQCLPGFTESRFDKQCRKCYYYKNNCFINCPKGTIQDSKSMNCFDIEIENQSSNTYLFIIFGTAFILFQIMVYILISLMIKSRSNRYLPIKILPKIGGKEKDKSTTSILKKRKGQNNSSDGKSSTSSDPEIFNIIN